MDATAEFEAHRDHLRGVAYRLLGSTSEAETTRCRRRGCGSPAPTPATVRNAGGWLTTVVGRVCLDMLRARTARGEVELGFLPHSRVATGRAPTRQAAVLADSVGLALLVVLNTLSPAERLAFVLHDVFACLSMRSRRSSIGPFRRPRCSPAVPAAGCAAPRPGTRPGRATRRGRGLPRRGAEGDLDALLDLLDPDVAVRPTPPPPVRQHRSRSGGAEAVAGQALAFARQSAHARPGRPTANRHCWSSPAGGWSPPCCSRSAGRAVTAIDIVGNPSGWPGSLSAHGQSW